MIMGFTSNAKDRSRAYDKVGKELREELQKLLANTLVKFQGTAIKESPIQTGFLRGSHQITIGRFEGKVVNQANYAGFVHDGTRFIRPNPWFSRSRAQTIAWLRAQKIKITVK